MSMFFAIKYRTEIRINLTVDKRVGKDRSAKNNAGEKSPNFVEWHPFPAQWAVGE